MKHVTASILVKDNKILIARPPEGDKLASKWEFSGGTIEEGETHKTVSAESLKRSLV